MDDPNLQEKTPLLQGSSEREKGSSDSKGNKIRLKRHITLLGACGILIGIHLFLSFVQSKLIIFLTLIENKAGKTLLRLFVFITKLLFMIPQPML